MSSVVCTGYKWVTVIIKENTTSVAYVEKHYVISEVECLKLCNFDFIDTPQTKKGVG